jgi:hypothetical protein
MQQPPPSGEDPNEPIPQNSYLQRALEPLQDPYTQPIQPYHPGVIPPVPSPQKKSSKGRVIAIGVALSLVVLLCLCAIIPLLVSNRSPLQQVITNDGSEAVIVATMPPEQAMNSNLLPTTPLTTPFEWVTTHTFEGNGNQKTEIFQIGDTWKIVWSCGAGMTSENVIIDVHFSDGTVLDKAAINTICDLGNNGGETIEHQGGAVYLNVVSEGGWSVRIQEQQ